MSWSDVEAELGLKLPQDFKEFCDYYPAIELDDFLYLTHPTARDKYDNFLSNAVIQGTALSDRPQCHGPPPNRTNGFGRGCENPRLESSLPRSAW